MPRRLGESGALNKLDQAREQVFYADLTTQVAAIARQRAEQRTRAPDPPAWPLGSRSGFPAGAPFPSLPARPQALPAIETEAIRRRVDLQIARIEADTLAKSYGLTNATRFINLLEVAGVSKTSGAA